ncbi:DUF2937 family protein [Alteromonas australica]|jgi:hypothetical protein|uniref:DUF2937 family protein n=1 Tax=Alteromonas australica TaxID=589873 RepID=UPI003F66BAE9
MLVRVFDKLIFAILFILALQVPILADHYRQYLSGYYDATREEVTALSTLAKKHGYPSANAMLEALKQNPEAVVREDAQRKAVMFSKLTDIEDGIRILAHGHYFEKLWYMATPSKTPTLGKVLTNYSPSIPLSPSSLAFSLVTAILLNLLFWSPYFCYCQVKKVKHAHHSYR